MKPNLGSRSTDIDESAESEITIQPDGRVFAFGITKSLVAVLAAIPTSDERTRRLLSRIGSLNRDAPAGEPTQTEEPK
jgi:hypothetical protein